MIKYIDMRPLIHTLFRLLESYIFVMAFSLVLGLAFPTVFASMAPYSSFLLQTIFFLTGLKIDFREVKRHIAQPLRLVIALGVMLIAFPIIAYPITNFFVPDAAVGIFLLAAMPSAMSAPLFASLAGGSIELTLVLSVLTSLLAPFTIPFVATITFGNSINIAPVQMLTDLLLVVFPPLMLAQIVRKFFHTHIEPASFTLKPLSILLLGFVTTGIIAKNAVEIFASFTTELIPLFIAVFLFAVSTHIIGYLVGIGKSHADKVAYAISLAYMNIVLAIYLAGRFFPHPKTILTTIIALLFWTVLFAVFRIIALKIAAAKSQIS